MKRRALAATAGLALLLSIAGVAALFLVPLPERLAADGARLVLYRDGSVAHVLLASDGRLRVPARLDEVDPDYVAALVEVEDRRFWWHPGVDPFAVARAAWQWASTGSVQSGASTLTMQVARMAEPRPRTLRSKALEALRALQLEARLSKEEILEAYLTLAPYGGNLEGIEAASLGCFGHRPSVLTDAEIAVLLAIPQDPTDRYPDPDHTPALRAARDRVATRLDAAGLLGETSLDDVRRAPVPERRPPLPRDAPHASRHLAAKTAGDRVATTLDRGVQAAVERAVDRFRVEAERMGIHNAAVVVAEHHTGRVAALVGNFDFWDEQHGGQIGAFAVPRSPGSALKPFLYAMAIDRGRLGPEMLLADIPVQYGAWSPDNYDGTFSGMVRAEDALSRSLNVPFVTMLDEVGVEPFVSLLRAGGATSVSSTPGHYGLSLVAGGIELTPLELATLYTGLAGDGRPYRLTTDADAEPDHLPSIMSPGAAWLTRRALGRRDRPDLPSLGRTMPHRIHWKTGTSYGHRDAWAVGNGERYTVAVWLGNVDFEPSVRLVGAAAAGPVMFDVFDALLDRGAPIDPVPDDLAMVPVCALSGHLATDACTHVERVRLPAATAPTRRCALHQTLELDVATGERVLPGCRAGRSTRTTTAVVFAPEVRRYLRDPGEPLPPLAAECADRVTTQGPSIVEPRDATVALLVPGLPPDDQELPLEADAPPGVLDWFVDGRHVGRAGADEPVWWTPSLGRHLVVVQDRAGNTDRRWVEVREL